jgi:VWFA-related protein
VAPFLLKNYSQLHKGVYSAIMRNSKRWFKRDGQLLTRFIACMVLVLLAMPLASRPARQEKPSTPAKGEQTPPALRVTTRLVQINVIAQRGEGKPISDLTVDDFAIFDKGQPQRISTFSKETTHTLVNATGTPPPPTNWYSNRLEEKAGVPTAITVILLDGLNTRFTDMAYARQQIIKFLSQLQPQDRVALYSLTNRLTVLHDFTSDATTLLAALKRHRTRDSEQLQASEQDVSNTGDDLMDQFLNEANQRMANFYTVNRALTTTGALEAIAEHVGRLPGRKNLIWVSGSFPFNIGMDDMSQPRNLQDARSFSDELERAARALNDANLAIYPVDARGLIPPVFAASAGPSRRMAQGKAPAMITMAPPHGNTDTMVILADRTGGRAYYNTNDIFGSIRQAIEDSQVTYVLGYYPTHGAWDGKWHELKVQVKRQGVHLRFRRGYFAMPEKPHTREEARSELAQALSSPLDFTTLAINARVDVVEVPGARTLKTEVHIDARDVTLELKGDRWIGELDLSYVQQSSEGKQLTSETRQINMHLNQQTYEQVKKNGLILGRDLSVVAGATQLRIVAQDAPSGSIGSVSVPLEKLFVQAK